MRKILIIIAAVTLFACEEEITLDLDSPPERLVVEGSIKKEKDDDTIEQVITLSLLNDFFDQSQTPRVTDAQVSVLDNEGKEYVFVHNENEPGNYENSDLIGEIGKTYVLNITWNGQDYEAEETLVSVASIENIYQKFVEENTFEDGGIKIAIDFQDPGESQDFYFWQMFVDGQNQITADPGNSNDLIQKDEFFNGQFIEGFFPSSERVFVPGETVAVYHTGISKNYFDYLFVLFEQTGQTGQLIDVPPALIKGNIRNLTNPENFAMGYFSASEVDIEMITIQE